MCVSNVITASPHPTYIPTRRPSDLLRAVGPAQDSGPRSCFAYFAPDSSWSRRFPDWTSGVPSRLRSTSCQEGQEKRSGRGVGDGCSRGGVRPGRVSGVPGDRARVAAGGRGVRGGGSGPQPCGAAAGAGAGVHDGAGGHDGSGVVVGLPAGPDQGGHEGVIGASGGRGAGAGAWRPPCSGSVGTGLPVLIASATARASCRPGLIGP